MIEIKEVKAEQILNPTSISLGEYVINPYVGCEFACLYCYVRSNRAATKRKQSWGTYIDVRYNAPSLLQKEISIKKPKTVLLGSTTECFQPIERKFGITRQILEILNQNGIYYVILTRSPDILDCLPLLKQGFCRQIYFTINQFRTEFKAQLESKSPDLQQRNKAVSTLINQGLPVIPYFCPILPWISQTQDVFSQLKNASYIEWECLNFSLPNMKAILDAIGSISPELKEKYHKMQVNPSFYEETWLEIERDISARCQIMQRKFYVHKHSWREYFKNVY